jgi:hypothetical protein
MGKQRNPVQNEGHGNMLRNLSMLAVALAAAATTSEAQACTVVALSGGLALNGSGTAITSEPLSGSTVSITTTILDGAINIRFDPPTWAAHPEHFNTGLATLQQKTSTLGTLVMNFDYTTGAIEKNFGSSLVGTSVITLHHKITAPSFLQGQYATKTRVTCS